MANRSANVRMFRDVARQRLEDAELLQGLGRDASAIYLAGYGVECGLKALILSVVPAKMEKSVLGEFRGTAGHDLDRLRHRYFEAGGASIPRELVRDFQRVSFWSVDLRYRPGKAKATEAERFLASVRAILEWAERRM